MGFESCPLCSGHVNNRYVNTYKYRSKKNRLVPPSTHTRRKERAGIGVGGSGGGGGRYARHLRANSSRRYGITNLPVQFQLLRFCARQSLQISTYVASPLFATLVSEGTAKRLLNCLIVLIERFLQSHTTDHVPTD